MQGPAGKKALLLFVLLAGYFLVNIAVRLSLPHTLELDEAEQVFYSQWLMLGYGPQPPLYNWLQTAIFELTGRTIFGLSLLKNLLIFTIYVFYWLAARVTLRDDGLKVVAVLALLTLPQVSFMAQQDLTHTVALLAATSMFLYAFYRILAAPDAFGYLLAGLAAALGLLSKYNFALLPLAALLAVLPEKDLRDRIFNRWLLAACAIAAILVLPHATWLSQNLGTATARTLEKMNEDGHPWSLLSPFQGVGSLIVATLAFSALTLVLFVLIHRRDTMRIIRAQTQTTRITGRMMAISLAALAMVVVATGSTHVRERWLDPFLLVLPLYLCMKIEAAGLQKRVLRPSLLAIPLVIMIAVPASLYLRVASSSETGKYTKLNVPFDKLAEEMRTGTQPSLIMTEDRHLAGNLMLNLPGVPVLTLQYPGFTLPVPKDGSVLLAWRAKTGAGMPDGLNQWAAGHGRTVLPSDTKTVVLPYHFARSNETFRFGYVVTKPAH